ncbi:hypothetical protein R1sor_008795 [Riccia sorocarpa]|uniref:Uncharacterized protein n=1 Tax=Riccia sorocarpa TaxID=122646 RepID=A0ABD3HXW2_9MARC
MFNPVKSENKDVLAEPRDLSNMLLYEFNICCRAAEMQMDPVTVEVREGDIPVAAVQVPPTFVVDEVTLGENPMEVAPVLASDHVVDEGEILLEVVDVPDSQEAVPVIGEAQEATTSSLVDGWQDDGKFVQLVQDLTDTRNKPQPLAEASAPNAVRTVEEEVPTPGITPNLENVEFSVLEYLP